VFRASPVRDLLASVTVAAVTLPLNITLTITTNLPPTAGLVAGAIGGGLAAIFGGAPLAVRRFTVAELPAKFALSDGDAMVPARSLSRFGEAQVSARISKSGDAVPQSGDIASNVVRAKVGAGDIKLELGK